METITPLDEWITRKINCTDTSLSRTVLDQYQFDKLQQVIQYARQYSPFYRNLFTGLPDRLDLMSDFSNYPFTRPDDIRNFSSQFVCVKQDDIQRIVTLPTSGTTGSPKRVFFTLEDQELTIDFFNVGMSTVTRKGDHVAILLPGQRPGSVGDLLQIGLERLGCASTIIGPFIHASDVLDRIASNGMNVLVGSPQQLQQLAIHDENEQVLEKGLIRAVLASTDALSHSIRSNLERIWGCEVFDHYGMTETGLGGGVECSVHQGVHLREADLYYEIIDPETGINQPAGRMGEVVVTTLTRKGMPLIRYRTGDMSRLIEGDCVCGSCIRRLENIRTRVGAGIRLESGMIHMVDLDEVLFGIQGLSDFSAVVTREAQKVVLEINIQVVGRELDEIVPQIREKIFQMPVIENEVKNGKLDIRISSMVQGENSPPGFLSKRVLVDQRTPSG